MIIYNTNTSNDNKILIIAESYITTVSAINDADGACYICNENNFQYIKLKY